MENLEKILIDYFTEFMILTKNQTDEERLECAENFFSEKVKNSPLKEKAKEKEHCIGITKKGEPCKKYAKDREQFCSTHSVSKTEKSETETELNPCQYLLKRGPKKGTTCDKNSIKDTDRCKAHTGKE
jgi:hypothetical protein